MNFVKTSILVIFIVIASPAALATIITFDETDSITGTKLYAAGTRIDNEYIASNGVTFNGLNMDQGFGEAAVVFDTDNYSGGDSDLAAPFINHNGNLGELSPGNVLIIHENIDTCDQFFCSNPDDEGSRPAGFFTIDFDVSTTINSIDFFDIEVEENNNTIISLFDTDGVLMKFYDTNGQRTHFHTPTSGGDNRWTRLDFGISGVGSMKVRLDGSGAIDNINYTQVPEPSTIAIFALGLLGLVSRKLKK